MGVEHRLSRASPHAPVSLNAVLNASSLDSGSEDRATLVTAHSICSPSVSDGEQTEHGSNTDATSVSVPPPRPSRPATSDASDTRSIRSSSSASRQANRLSLTLPIALPNSLPSRPTPASSSPPTPIDPSVINSPVESDGLIIAIAAQERRVLELREELTRAEGELKRLQRQWTISEACKKRPPNNSTGPPAPLAPAINLRGGPGDGTIRPNSELERRKAILLAQSQGTPRQHKRTVIRGGHTRTLSLLSPVRSRDLSANDDLYMLQSTGSYTSRSPSPPSQTPNKRATWAPLQSAQQSSGVNKLATDLKQGLWTFVEDLRQATVGDEAISGTTHRTAEMGLRSTRIDGDQNTIRASTANRGRIPFPTETDSSSDSPSRSSTSSPNDRFHKRTKSRPEPRPRKHFSWTPLTFDAFNDDDWSSWDSPNVKTSRWSSSTVEGDVAPATPEKAGESEATLRRQWPKTEPGLSSAKALNKLEDLPQAILNHLKPSNIKNTTSTFLKEWEKSLSPPPQTSTFEAGLQDFARSAH